MQTNPDKQILIKTKRIIALLLDMEWVWGAALVIHLWQQNQKSWRPNSKFVQMHQLLWIMRSLWWEHEVEGDGGLSMSTETLLSLCPWGNLSHLLAKTWYAWSAPPPGLSLTNCEWQQTFCLIIKEEDEEIFLQAWSVHDRALHFPRRLDSLWQ